MKWRLIWSGCVMMCMFAILGCRSTKNVASEDKEPAGKGPREWVEKMATMGLKDGTVTSKLHLDLSLDGKSLSVGGNCNLKRDEVIQLSLVALGFMEVGRLEFTPEYMMMVNRMERQYVKVAYKDVSYMQQAGIDFYTLQALFWNDVFVPGKSGQWNEGDFSMTQNKEEVVLTSRADHLLCCRFVVDLVAGLIRNTSVEVLSQMTAPRLEWDYRHFTEVGQKSFPDKMQLSLSGIGKQVSAMFTLSNVRWNAKTVEPTQEPGSRYKKVSPESILKQLIR